MRFRHVCKNCTYGRSFNGEFCELPYDLPCTPQSDFKKKLVIGILSGVLVVATVVVFVIR